MIVNAFFDILGLVLNIVLAPLTVINIGIDFVSGIPVVSGFLEVIAYLIPWGNLVPLFTLVISILVFKVAISTISAIWSLIPFM